MSVFLSMEVKQAANIANSALRKAVPLLHFFGARFPDESEGGISEDRAKRIVSEDIVLSVVRVLRADGRVNQDEVNTFVEIFSNLESIDSDFKIAGRRIDALAFADYYHKASEHNEHLATSHRFESVVLKMLRRLDSEDGTFYAIRYAEAIFRILNLVARADGDVTAQEVEELKQFLPKRGFSPKNTDVRKPDPDPLTVQSGISPRVDSNPIVGELTPAPERRADAASRKEGSPPRSEAPAPIGRSLDSLLSELKNLVGLDGVKREIEELCNFVRVQQMRKDQGLRTPEISLHMVFSGSPGTGKTTVARLVAEIFAVLGVVSKGHLVETDRAGLVGGYLGQTAIRVASVVDSARGGVLFIDEAYSLAGGKDAADSYGAEAISVLLKRMEDLRDDLVVVVAGYSEQMSQFIDANPGLRSRFTKYLSFDDYSPEQLERIAIDLAEKLDYLVTPAARWKFRSLFDAAYSARDRSFGNGRFVRNAVEKAIARQATRVMSLPKVTVPILRAIEPEDVPALSGMSG